MTTFTYDRKDRTGYSPGADIIHHFHTSEPVSADEAESWVQKQDYFGYNPAGYGGTLRQTGPTSFTWTHAASCD